MSRIKIHLFQIKKKEIFYHYFSGKRCVNHTMSRKDPQNQDRKRKVSDLVDENKALKLDIEAKNVLLQELLDKQKHLFDQLKDKIECPVCLEVPLSGPAPVCPNGHFVCTNCKAESCPTCRAPMGNNRSLLAVIVIENIEHECKFDVCGEVFTVVKLENHHKICKHRTVICPYNMCMRMMSLTQLLDHLERDCSANNVFTEIESSSQSFTTIGYVGADEQESYWSWMPSVFSSGDVKFAIIPVKSENFYFFSIVMFEVKRECSKYGIELIVHEEGSTSHDSAVSYKFCGKPSSIDEPEADVKYLGLTVSNSGMTEILKTNVGKEFSLSFNISYNG